MTDRDAAEDLLVDRLAKAVLYEGYCLFPYRPSSLKNRSRAVFGSLYPRDWSQRRDGSDPWLAQTECLVRGGGSARIEARVRFLQPVPGAPASGSSGDPCRTVEREAILGPISLDLLAGEGARREIAFPERGPEVEGAHLPPSGGGAALLGALELKAIEVRTGGDAAGLFRLTLRLANHTPVERIRRGGPRQADGEGAREEAQQCAFLSTQALLRIDGGEFISPIDPPEDAKEHARACRNLVWWPVLAGKEGSRRRMFAAPIILHDYPRVSAESPGDWFDATEIDELLTLCVRTLPEGEKSAIREADPRAGSLLERAEALSGETLLGLHSSMRRPGAAGDANTPVRPGDRVLLQPGGRADIFDLTLAGKTAVVETIEQDAEGRGFVTVTVDCDPGRDLGKLGKPGHRFFFRMEEVVKIGGGREETS